MFFRRRLVGERSCPLYLAALSVTAVMISLWLSVEPRLHNGSDGIGHAATSIHPAITNRQIACDLRVGSLLPFLGTDRTAQHALIAEPSATIRFALADLRQAVALNTDRLRSLISQKVRLQV